MKKLFGLLFVVTLCCCGLSATALAAVDQAQCRPDGLYTTPDVTVPYCDVYDTSGREKLPNNLHRRIIGYFASWRTGAGGTPKYIATDIPWNKLSHVNYAFAWIGADGKISVNADVSGNPATDMTWPNDPDATMDPSLGYTGEFNLIHQEMAAHPGVKVIISVGGWANTGGYTDADGNVVHDGGFFTMTESQAKIDKFADSVVAFLRKYGFSGVDIDYEYPSSMPSSGNPDDFWYSNSHRGQMWTGYVNLMKTLRQKLDAASAQDGKDYLLTAAVPASGWILRGMQMYQVTQYLDYVNLMSYDLHGSWNQYVGGLAALFDGGHDPELTAAGVYNAYDGEGYLNTDWAYHYFRGAMPAGRINIGVPYYTRGWQGVTQSGSPTAAYFDHGLYGIAEIPDPADCPPGTGPDIGAKTCGNGATGINNVWHDSNTQGGEIPSGVNPIWHVLNLQHGIIGSYLDSYGIPVDEQKIVGEYDHYFDSTTKVEWWWDPTTHVLLTGDSDEAIQAKANYVANKGIGGIMIWELAGDYAYNSTDGQYEMGDHLTTLIYNTFTQAGPYGNTTAAAGETMPTQAIPFTIKISGFRVGANNYPMAPTITFINNSKVNIPAGSTITFDYATSNYTLTGQVETINKRYDGSNVGGLEHPFNTARYTLPSYGSGIPANGGQVDVKFRYQLPMASISNIRIDINGTVYGATWDHARGVTIGYDLPTCSSAPAWNADTRYQSGDKVNYNGNIYTAKYSVKGGTPDSSSAWQVGQSCTGDGGNPPPSSGNPPPSSGNPPPSSGNPPPSSGNPPPSSGGGTSCTSVPAWSASQTYNGGAQVSYDGNVYSARYWTKGNQPDQSGQWGPWKLVGPCSGGGNNPPPSSGNPPPSSGNPPPSSGNPPPSSGNPPPSSGNPPPSSGNPPPSSGGSSCGGAPQYVDGNSYATGDTVQNNGHEYQCKVGGWCTVGGPYAPGAGWAWTSAWSDLGACTN